MSQDKFTKESLLNILKSTTLQETSERDITTLKYVIYVRKSTDTKDKQERSLEDQLSDCLEVKERLGLNVIKVIQESQSAKEPGVRPLFRQMITELENGTYDGVIAWHPNRIARNMRDAGEVIDLLDKDIIKDLQFVAHSFQNDSSGKMLLGITFVMAKQYSDNLSRVVKRGNQKNIEVGRYPNKTKWGYVKDRNSYLQPDGDNFTLLKEGFNMRIKGKSLVEIAEYLNKNGIARMNSRNGKQYSLGLNKTKLSLIFKDPMYAGIIKYGNTVVDLTEVSDFLPMITSEEFMKINQTDNKGMLSLAIKKINRPTVRANLLRGYVDCSECGDTLSSGITTKKKKDGSKENRYYYKCENEDCVRLNKSTRPKVILDFVYEYFKSKPFSSIKSYQHFQTEMKRVLVIRNKDASQKLKTARRLLSEKTEYLKALKENLLIEKDSDLKAEQNKARKLIQKEIIVIDTRIIDLEDKLKQSKSVINDYSEFLELFENMGKTLKNTKDMKVLDTLLKKIFSNFVVDSKNVVSYTLNAPFGAFERISKTNVSSGGELRTSSSYNK